MRCCYEARAPPSIPAPPPIPKGFPTLVRDGDRVLQLDEAATGMRDRRLDRDDHARLKRAVGVIGRIRDWPVAGEARRLMADEAHPMRYEFDRIRARRSLRALRRRWRRCRRRCARPDRLARRHLDLVHLTKQLLEFAVRLALDRHATEVADIAFVIAAGIKRQDVARPPDLVGRRAVEARPRRDEAIFECQSPADLFTAKRFDEFALLSRPARARRSPPAWNRRRVRTRCAADPVLLASCGRAGVRMAYALRRM